MISVGDLVRVYDPDESHIDGNMWSAIGLVLRVDYKSPDGYRILSVLVGDREEVYDEPYWAFNILSFIRNKID